MTAGQLGIFNLMLPFFLGIIGFIASYVIPTVIFAVKLKNLADANGERVRELEAIVAALKKDIGRDFERVDGKIEFDRMDTEKRREKLERRLGAFDQFMTMAQGFIDVARQFLHIDRVQREDQRITRLEERAKE